MNKTPTGDETVSEPSNDNDKEDETGARNEIPKGRLNGGRPKPPPQYVPFDVSVVSPPPRYLGRVELDPHTHCGDIVEYEGHHFEVKVVRLRYRLLRGRYRVVGKSIEVKSLARKAIEVYLERKYHDS